MYDNKILSRLTETLSSVGFLITKFSHKPWKAGEIKLCLRSCKVHGVPETSETSTETGIELTERTVGEKSNLVRLLKANDWRHAFSLVQDIAENGDPALFNMGDFIPVEFDVPAASHDGLDFPARHIKGKVQIIEVMDNKVLFGFDEIIFKSAINAKDKNEGGFSQSALAKYLNTEFYNAMGVNVLTENNDGLFISLPTATELFGDDEDYWEPETNYFDEPEQLSYFTNTKNRIMVWEDDTHWYWTSSKRASSAASFCICGNNGDSGNDGASSVGGVAPVLCVAKRH